MTRWFSQHFICGFMFVSVKSLLLYFTCLHFLLFSFLYLLLSSTLCLLLPLFFLIFSRFLLFHLFFFFFPALSLSTLFLLLLPSEFLPSSYFLSYNQSFLCPPCHLPHSFLFLFLFMLFFLPLPFLSITMFSTFSVFLSTSLSVSLPFFPYHHLFSSFLPSRLHGVFLLFFFPSVRPFLPTWNPPNVWSRSAPLFLINWDFRVR